MFVCVWCGIWLYVIITKGYWVREMVLGLLLGLIFLLVIAWRAA